MFFVLLALLSTRLYPQDQTVDAILESLKSTDPASLASVIEDLPKDALLQVSVVRHLMLLLDDERPIEGGIASPSTIQQQVLWKMSELPSNSVRTILQSMSGLESTQARCLALQLISSIGDSNHSDYLHVLTFCNDADDGVRSLAVQALSVVSDKKSDETVQQFAKFLKDDVPAIRWTSLDALSLRHERLGAVLPAIVELLDDRADVQVMISDHFGFQRKIQGKAAQVLARVGAPAIDAVPKLRSLTRPEYDPFVRIWGATAICKILESPPPEYLEWIGEQLLVDFEDEDAENDAPQAIAELGPRAVPLLDVLERAKGHSSALMRMTLVKTFFAVDASNAALRVLPMMEDKEDFIVVGVIKELAARKFSEPSVIDAYIVALGKLGKPPDEPALAAVEALSELGSAAKPAIPALEKLRRNPEISDDLRAEVDRALDILR